MKKFPLIALAVSALLLSGCNMPGVSTSTNSGTPGTTSSGSSSSGSSTTASTGGSADLQKCVQSCGILESGTGLISRETCEIGCWIQEAKDQKNAGLCKQHVSDGLMLAGCVNAVAEVTGNPDDCTYIGNDSLMADSCFMVVAKQKKDPSICGRVSNSFMKVGCEQDVKGE